MRATWAVGLTLTGTILLSADQGPTLSITTPEQETVVSGPTPVVVAVSKGAAVKTVSVFVNGRLICTAERPPFGCTWDAGAVVRAHHIRVVATLADGTQLTDNVRTRDVGYTERAHVDAVLVPIIVTDRGKFVSGLQRQDFEVLEDGVPQQLAAFASEDSPLDLVLAIDVSGSMERALDDVKVAVKQLLSKLRPGDAATLIGFNDTTFLVAEREKDQRAREDAVGLLTAWGGTALYDATVRAIDLVSRSPGRKGVVLFSDGDDRHSLTPPEAAAARVQSGNAMLYSVGFGAGASVPALRLRLEEYARSTGGRAFYPGQAEELGAVFGQVITELSNQYVLSYVSSNPRADGAWRSIRVRVRKGKYDVRARRGYQAVRPRGAGKATP
jgi:Ca-activated chloride channel family protein